ncbi:MAG: serine/threonine-protein kinase [Deltaproteobacteria bacterium]|nr:serine/threonine-protein kinase [Deltaproteobacteria bacterium]
MSDHNEDESGDVLPVGTQFGRYVVNRLVGMGGMGAVYEATHLELKKRVALKTLHPSYARNTEIRARFLREGELASRIQHNHVVDVTDFGTQDDIAFLVMEFLEGMSLEAHIEKHGRLEPMAAVDIMLGACAGVAAAHDEDVVHRDLKPANIFLLRQRRGDYRVKIVDFGISKATEGKMEGSLTSTGHVVGTPFYMAPEQMRSSREVDHRADQYSLGVTLYEAMVGAKPFQGDSLFEVVRKVAQGEYAKPRSVVPEIPEALEAATLRAMAIEASTRFESVRAFGSALLPFASDRARMMLAAEFGEGDLPPPSSEGTGAYAAVAASSPGMPGLPESIRPPSNKNAVTSASGLKLHLSKTPTVTGQSFEVSRVPDAPKSRMNPLIPVGGVAVVAVLALGFWAGQQGSGPPAEQHQTRSVPARAAPVENYAVSISATPSDAWIIVDDQFTVPGQFARSFPRNAQPHRVLVRAPGYLPQRLEFSDAMVRSVSLTRDPAAQSPVLSAVLPDAAAPVVQAQNSGNSGVRTGTGRNPRNGSSTTENRTGNPPETNTGTRPTGPGSQRGTNGALILN